jgi:two-component system, NtrC family, response regulator
MKFGRILVVEDDESLRRVTQVQLEKEGYETTAAFDVPQALEILKASPHDLVLTDLNLPGPSGLDLLKRIRAEYPDTTVVVVTAYGTVESAVDAMKCGAYDYLTKPVHPYELRMLVHRALERHKLMEEIRTLRSTIDQKFGFENIIGHSGALLHVLDSAARVAQTDATVLILGETGTGKELLAKAIHFNSHRRERPFVVINCGAIPRDLLESELFGHVKGAFTGALTHKKGKVEMAQGGTVFLDEIGEMPLDLQVRVLRLIQEREIEKVGAPIPVQVDVRIIAATHRDLEALVASGTFREDLYYRLAVVPIALPPLRARAEDITEFVVEFFRLSAQKHNRPTLSFPQTLIPYFSRYPWPGNVRQLQNAIERMVVLCRGDEITVSDLPDFLLKQSPSVEATAHPDPQLGECTTLDAVDREVIVRALRQCNWNQTKAAIQLGLTRKILMRRMAKLDIRRDDATTRSLTTTGY